jgi:hypothetical protein
VIWLRAALRKIPGRPSQGMTRGSSANNGYTRLVTQVSAGRASQRARALGLLLVVTLVFAQTGALLHEYSHLRASGDATLPGQTCADCLAFSPLLTTAGAAHGLPLVLPADVSAPLCHRSVPSPWRAPRTAFLARGPPSLV